MKDQLALARLGADRGMAVEVYDEQGRSGETIEERPTMQQLLADVQSGTVKGARDGRRIAAIVAVDWNRLSRDEDLLDGLRIKKVCKDNGVLLLTPSKVYDFAAETDGFLSSTSASGSAPRPSARKAPPRPAGPRRRRVH